MSLSFHAANPGGTPVPRRVVICWTDISGYMGGCWRELAARSDIDLRVIAFAPSSGVPFDQSVIADVKCQLLSAAERDNAEHVASLVVAHDPQVVILCGWATKAYVALATNPKLAGAKFAIALDTPLKRNLRQRIGKFWARSLMTRMSAAIVAGERSANLAAYLGIPRHRVYRGMYAVDVDAMGTAADLRSAKGQVWPRRFLYVGRYAPEKGIEDLVTAYKEYRTNVSDPWPLSCCGKGDLQSLLRSEGINDIGFTQPAQLPGVFAEYGVLVLPSHYEPWGAALVEGCAAGLPVIATDACGASLDVVRSFHNGLLVPSKSSANLARAMRWMHDHVDRLPEMGRRSRELASAFSAQRWADRWQDMIEQVQTG
jgi:glycosyltransferase involved in cell wall biosynthesis